MGNTARGGEGLRATIRQFHSEDPTAWVLIEVLHKNHFILSFVVNQFVDLGLGDHDAEAAWAQTLLLSKTHVIQRAAFRMANGGMGQTFEAESRPRIGNAIEQHATGTDAGDPYLAVRIELTAPLNGVEQQFAKHEPHRIP